MPIDESRFRQVMGRFASGVTVVTTAHAGRFYGMTISSFASLSLQPPLVLICVDLNVSTHAALRDSGSFAVNILDQRQEHLSRRFSSRDDDKFTGVAWRTGDFGLPILEGVLAAFECRVREQLPGGDHTIFIGEVITSEINEGTPLLYYRGGYHELK